MAKGSIGTSRGVGGMMSIREGRKVRITSFSSPEGSLCGTSMVPNPLRLPADVALPPNQTQWLCINPSSARWSIQQARYSFWHPSRRPSLDPCLPQDRRDMKAQGMHSNRTKFGS